MNEADGQVWATSRGSCSGPRCVAMPREWKGQVLRPHQGGLAGGRVGALGPGWPVRRTCPRSQSPHRQDCTWEGRRSGVLTAIHFNYVT